MTQPSQYPHASSADRFVVSVSNSLPELTRGLTSAPDRELTQGSRVRMAWATALVLCGALAVTQVARADDDSERENLARIVNELERVEGMARGAAADAPSGQRVKFRYDWLVRDLQLMREGIEQHVDAPRQPRPVAPLKGDYRQ